jgi:aminopeptidase N
MNHRALAFACFCLCILAVVLPEPAALAAAARVVLPDAVTPERYRIDIVPDAEGLTFKGTVQIDITVHSAVDRIVLNGADLVIDSAAVAGIAAAPAVSYDQHLGRITFALGRMIEPGAHTLTLSYHGKIYLQGSGFFAVDYAVPQGKARALFTQFENADARRFVPCWDEPGRKAIFELSATLPANFMALSNMPVAESEALPGNQQHVHFAPTPRMSSYLLFFGAGDFERSSRSVDGVDVGVVVKRGDLAQANFVLDAAADILHYYNDYFGTPFPLPKLDLIAGPGSSVTFGAMENWGAIFSWESEMLVDPRIASEGDRQRAYIVAAHEMAHQWFGDLVTMQWWDDLWLNEGFASWMESKVTDHFHPEWRIWLQRLDDRQQAMELDAREGTHPIITPLVDSLQALEAFDEIAYEKGSAVIRTLESYVGEDAFRAGVRRYIQEKAYGNAVTDDLWLQMDRGSERPITQIAHDLTLQAGVPMISEVSSQCVGESTTLKLSQGRYVIDADSTAAQLWHVPVALAAIGDPSSTTLIFGTPPTALQVAGCAPVVINVGQTAYFRTRYAPAGLSQLTAHFAQLASIDQLGLMDDTQSLAYNGEEPMGALLSIADGVPVDAAPEVVTALAATLQDIDLLCQGLPMRVRFRLYARGVLNRFFDHIGWDRADGEADNVALLRTALIDALGQMDDPAVVAEARRRFALYIAEPARVDAAVRKLVLDTAAVHADQPIWDQLHALARSTASEIERLELYELLAAAEDDRLVREALDLSLSGEPPPTVIPHILQGAAVLHPRLSFEFTAANWQKLSDTIEPDFQIRFAPRLLKNSSDASLIAPLDAFARAHIPPDKRLDVRKTQASLRYRARVRRERLPDLEHVLRRRESDHPVGVSQSSAAAASAASNCPISSDSGAARRESKCGDPSSDM